MLRLAGRPRPREGMRLPQSDEHFSVVITGAAQPTSYQSIAIIETFLRGRLFSSAFRRLEWRRGNPTPAGREMSRFRLDSEIQLEPI